MPCTNDNHHTHVWVTEGPLTIERCEKICGFCGKESKHGWFTRRHVSDVHTKEFPKLIVMKGWTTSPTGNRKPKNGETRGRRRGSSSSRTSSKSPAKKSRGRTPSETIIESIEPAEIDLNGYDLGLGVYDPLFTDPSLGCHIPGVPTILDDVSNNWVTPQSHRTNEIFLEGGVMPRKEVHAEASVLATGLDDLVGKAMGGARMGDPEILYVLETFLHGFKAGIKFEPMK